MVRLPRVPRWTQWVFPQMEWRVPGVSAHLTFDDGPHPEITPWVLDQLEKGHVKATFFLVGNNAKKYPYLVEEILRRGHQVGNHTTNHLRGTACSTRDYMQDVIEAENYTSTKLFRPPYGRLRRKQMLELIKRGYRIIMWEVLSYDFDEELTSEDCLKILQKNTRSGSIVVFHDSEKAWPRLEKCLPLYLMWLKQKGLT
jgi:peptidoglycan-N-acetylglucosamine deacetylase